MSKDKKYTKEDFLKLLDRVDSIHNLRNKSLWDQLNQLGEEKHKVAVLRGSIMALNDNFILPEETKEVLLQIEQAADIMDKQFEPKED